MQSDSTAAASSGDGSSGPRPAAIPTEERIREYPTRALPLAVVLLAVVGSLMLLLIDFRLGAAALAGSVGIALLLRLFLSDDRAGLLVVRRRSVDIAFLGALTVALALLAAIVPPPPG